jgi:hypothetical protein
MQVGSVELVRATSAWLACIGFALAFLVSVATGALLWTAALRGAAAAVATLIAGRWLLPPLFAVLLDALARDRAARAKETDR